MLKLSVGCSRKIGDANYGSRGASVNLEVELDCSDGLRAQMRRLFDAAQASVDDELNRQPAAPNAVASQPTLTNCRQHQSVPTRRGRDNTRPATGSQVRALDAIAKRQQLQLSDVLHQRFGVTQAADLSIREASALIAEFNASNDGHNGATHP